MKTVFRYANKTASLLILLAMSGICASLKAQNSNVILVQADSLSKVKNYTGAITLLEKNINLFETGKPNDALVWSRLGDYCYMTKDYEKAKTCYLKYLDSRRPYLEYNQDVSRYLDCLSSLLNTYSNLSDYRAAIYVCKESIELIRCYYKEHSWNYASHLAEKYGSLSWYYLFIKDYPLAEQAAQKALNIDSTKTWVKTNLAHAMLFHGKTRKAEEIYGNLARTVYRYDDTYALPVLYDFEQLEKAQIIPPNVKQDVERIKIDLSMVNETVKIYKQFKSLCNAEKYEEALILIQPYKYRLPESHTRQVVDILEYKGKEYKDSGNYEQAEKCYMTVTEIRKNIFSKYDYAKSLEELGDLYRDMDNYKQTEKYYIEAKELREEALGKVFGKEHHDYIKSLKTLGTFYWNMDNYEQAEKYFTEEKEIQEKFRGKKSSEYVSSLNRLGIFHEAMGNYAQAKKCYIGAKEILETEMIYKNDDYANTLNNLGDLYCRDMGDYVQAEKYYMEAKEIREKIWGKEDSYYASSLSRLGTLYGNMGNYSQAEKYYVEAKEILKKVLGKEHEYYDSAGNASLAKTKERTLNTYQSRYATYLNNLGKLYHKMGDYTQAEKYCLEAKEIREKLGEDYASSLSLGLLYNGMGDYERATVFTNRACESSIQTTNRNFVFLSEQQRNLYWKTQAWIFETGYSLSWLYPVAATNTLNYNNTLFTKGLLLRTATAIRDAIYSSGNRTLIGQYKRLGNLRKEIIDLQKKTDFDQKYVEVQSYADSANNSAKIDTLQQIPDFNGEYAASLESRADSLDKALTQAAAAFVDLKAGMFMQWQDVQKQLISGDAAIEFVHFRLYDKDWTDTTLYAAMVLRPGMKSPAWIPLCEQKQLQAVLHTDTRDTREQTETLYSGKGGQLYQLVWQALETELPNVKNIYYSPSGLLHKIAFNALPVGRDSMLLSDKYNLHLVSSTREIARLKKETSAALVQDTTVVYGGLTYDLRQSAMAAAAKSYRGRQKDGDSRYIDRFRRRDAELPEAGLRSGFSEWQYLSGTKTETEQIVGSLSGKRIPHQYYTESNGNEESFKYLSGTQTGVIHLATHGFFLPDIENKAVENIVQRLGGNKAKPFENPLLRSGLILSGANNQWVAKEFVMEDGVEDGILTADEISRLNLTRTKLVVLSACETGLGDVKNSEGVFGLQRAFKLAGVESLIMSLWKVPDEPTAELMTAFYDEWLSGATKQTAFKTAQQKVRAKYKSPYYWAAFVMMD